MPPTLGGGEYNAHSAAQHGSAAQALAFLPQAISVLRPFLPSPSSPLPTVTVVDYGCSEGKNSVAHLSSIVTALRSPPPSGAAIAPSTPITLVFNDLPNNDWMSLARTLSAWEALRLAKGEVDGSLFPLFCPRSFFQQVLPAGTVHVGWSNASTHWLSYPPPPPMKTAVVSYAATDPDERRLWTAAAAKDWAAFLTARSAELIPGGILLLSCLLSQPTPDHPPPVGEEEPLWKILRQLCTAGLLTDAELTAINFPTYYRTYEETCGAAVLGRHGLRLLAYCQREEFDNPLKREWREHGDVRLFARQQCGILKATGYGVFESVIGKERADAFFETLEGKLRQDPNCFDLYLPIAAILIQKHPEGVEEAIQPKREEEKIHVHS